MHSSLLLAQGTSKCKVGCHKRGEEAILHAVLIIFKPHFVDGDMVLMHFCDVAVTVGRTPISIWKKAFTCEHLLMRIIVEYFLIDLEHGNVATEVEKNTYALDVVQTI